MGAIPPKQLGANNMKLNLWIDADYDTQAGQIGFLIEREHNLQGWRKLHISDVPAHGNMDHRPHLNGWCGTTNDVAVYAHGMARVVKISKNGNRAYVHRLFGTDLSSALEEAGYPEL
jgi:hypothetical protein